MLDYQRDLIGEFIGAFNFGLGNFFEDITMAEAQQWTEERLEKLKKLWDEFCFRLVNNWGFPAMRLRVKCIVLA